MPEELQKVKNNHDISIALIQKDIEYIKQSVNIITTQIQMMDKHYVRHDELSPFVKTIEQLKTEKVDKTDFEPIKTTLYRINWLMIATVVGGVLALLSKVGRSL